MSLKTILRAILFAGLVCWQASAQTTPATPTGQSSAATDVNSTYFSNWPDGTSPRDIGKRVAENFVKRGYRFENNSNPAVIYPEVIAWYGALTFAKVANDDTLKTALIKKFDFLLTPDGAKHISAQNHVDFHVFGAVPLEIYMQIKDKRYLDLGQGIADAQQASVFTANGYSSEARFWVDDLYMLPIAQLEAYRATGNKKYLDRTAELVVAYLDKLQQPSGLFFHGTDAPYYWNRGNGWVAAGLAELLRDLPADHPQRARVMDGYKKMMTALLKYQGKDGLWRELTDHLEAWAESSGSAMFTFSMVTGVKNGWLDAATYGPAARSAWLGLVKLIDKDGNIANVCPGTNKWTPANGEGVQFYLGRVPLSGADLNTYNELHGNAPVLWSATALLR